MIVKLIFSNFCKMRGKLCSLRSHILFQVSSSAPTHCLVAKILRNEKLQLEQEVGGAVAE